ncbi:unnamed protein product, partial [Trichobilharzia regenti]
IIAQGIASTSEKSTESVGSSENQEQRFKSPSTSNFERDVWEFMIRVFRNDLTHKELFRNTFSSDCMHSTERLDSRVTRNHKINWSVGSYGIFVRYPRRRVSIINSTSFMGFDVCVYITSVTLLSKLFLISRSFVRRSVVSLFLQW